VLAQYNILFLTSGRRLSSGLWIAIATIARDLVSDTAYDNQRAIIGMPA